MQHNQRRWRCWRDEQGSQALQAAGAALAAAIIVLALLAGARSIGGPSIVRAFECAAAALTGGASCEGQSAQSGDQAAQPPQSSQSEQQNDHKPWWETALDVTQVVLDVAGLVPGLGEIADGANGLISLARGDYTGAALSFAAMIPFAGWGATGAKWVRTGIRYSDEIAGTTRYGDEAGAVVRCFTFAPPGKGPGLAKPLANICVKITDQQLQKKFKHAADFGVTGNYNKANAQLFREAIEKHVNGPNTRAITGTYRGQPVTHYFDPTTGLNVIVDNSGNFVSGWRLSPDQITHVTTTGNLGGG